MTGNNESASLGTREASQIFMSRERQSAAAESGIFGWLRNAGSNFLGNFSRRVNEQNEAARENNQQMVIQGETIPVVATAILTIFLHVDGVPYNPYDIV